MEQPLIKNKDWEKTFDAIDDWIAIIDIESTIIRSNRIVEKYFDIRVKDSIGTKCCEMVHGTKEPVNGCPIPKMLKTKKRESAEVKIKDGRWMLITVDPILNSKGEILSAVHIVRDITGSVENKKEKANLIKNLKSALDKVKMLSGLIPICSNCNKIRDDSGYWNQIEFYIEKYSEAHFSHGMCPKCMEKLYGDQGWYKKKYGKE